MKRIAGSIAVDRICGIPSFDNKSFLNYWTVDVISGEASITSNEATDFKWVTIEELRRLSPTFEDDIEVYEQLVNSEKINCYQH